MGAAARRLVRSRLATFVVCAGGMLLAMPGIALADPDWSSSAQTVASSSGAATVATGVDSGPNVIAVWADGTGIRTSVRPSSSATWAAGSTLQADAGASAPDIAVASDGTAVATWIGSDNNAYADVRSSAGAWGGAVPLSADGKASSAQAAMLGANEPAAFWIDNGVIASNTFVSGMWGTAATSAAPTPATTISDLHVAIDSTGDGAATWIRDDGSAVHVDEATISAGAWTIGATLSDSASVAASDLSVATNGTLSVIAWTDSTGLHTAVSTGSGFSAEAGGGDAAGAQPAVGFDSGGRVFEAYTSGSSVVAKIRETNGNWGSATPLNSSGSAPSVVGDGSGDVVVMWTTGSSVQMLAYDATPPTVTVNVPASPATPGAHTWSVNVFDLWSGAGATSWLFSDNGATQVGMSVSHNSSVPGPVSATVTQLDGAGNSATVVSPTVTISSTPPTNTALPTITDGSAPNDGDTLDAAAGTWHGTLQPTVTRVWQRCGDALSCSTISGQTGLTYTLVPADVGFKIRVEESGTNGGGTVKADSLETPVVAPKTTGSPDLNLSAPTVADGVTLTAVSLDSDWDNVPGLNLTYHFQRCTPGCTDVQATGANTYKLRATDVGATYQVQVSAKAGTVDGVYSANATENSSQTAVVAPLATAAPTLTGTPQDTRTLTASSPDSSWDGATGLTKTYEFFRCDANGANCSLQQSSTTNSTYLLAGDDLGWRIKAIVLGSIDTSAAIPSAASALTAVIAPWLTTAPATPSGTPKDGQTLTVSPGTWADSTLPGFAFQYQWVSCPSGTNCAPIAGANLTTYSLKPSDVGATIKVIVTATFGTASTQATTAPTAAVAPQNTSPSSITPPAPAADGGTFQASPGGWNGALGLNVSYQWKRCDSSGDGCSNINGATSSSYTAGGTDVGGTLVVNVSASAGGSAVTPSSDSGHTAVVAPLSTGLADMSGAPQDTQTLTASTTAGDWDGVTGLTTTYQFMRCNSSGGACVAIAGATGSTYVLKPADIGSKILVYAFASKGGSVAIQSGASTVSSIITPLLLGSPNTPTGTVQDGSTLSAGGAGTTQGTWADQAQLSFRYEWFHCTSGCTSLGAPSASSTYQLQPTDVGDTIQVIVTAFVGAGAASSTSTQTVAVAPLSTAASSISTPTTQQDGQVFSASPGGWDGAVGLGLKYVWKRCDQTGGACNTIASATNASYSSTPADVGFTLRASVSAFKGSSATTPAIGDSAQTSVIAPLSTAVPQIAGTPTDGQTLTTTASTNAAWDSTPATLAFAYQWLRCDAGGANCAAIAGATATSYLLTPDDVATAGDPTHAGHKITVRVTASVNGVSTSSVGAATAPIKAIDTKIMILPSVSGDSIANQPLTANHGSWTGTDISEVSYQWVRCDPPFTNCTNLGAASLTATTYLLQAADVGHYVSFVETVSNRLGTLSTQRAPFGNPVLSNVLGATDEPVVSGSYVDGAVLSTTDGAWVPADDLTFGYVWLRCPALADGTAPTDTNSCQRIPGSAATTYTLTGADVGSYILSQVRATYSLNGFTTFADQPSDLEGDPAVAASPPVNSARPTVAGVAKQDSTLSASTGTWTGTNTAATPITYTYQWLRCDTGGAACQPISGATSASYGASAQDVGSRLEVRVTGTNSGGAASASSDPTGVIVGSAPPSPPNGGGSTGGTGGTGGGTHTAGNANDKSAPRLTLAFVGGGTLAGGTTLSVTATCPKTETNCKAKFHLLASLKKTTGKAISKPVTIASASTTLKGGQKKLLKLKLSSAGRSALRKFLKLKVTLSVSVTDAAGNVTPSQTKGITLRWKKA